MTELLLNLTMKNKNRPIGTIIILLIIMGLASFSKPSQINDHIVLMISRDIGIEGYQRDTIDTTGSSRAALDQFLLAIKANPNYNYEVKVYLNSMPESGISTERSLWEAETIVNYLIAKGVNANNVKPVGMEFKTPVISSPKSPIDYWINHRVELVMAR